MSLMYNEKYYKWIYNKYKAIVSQYGNPSNSY
jgi:hypothetical protein